MLSRIWIFYIQLLLSRFYKNEPNIDNYLSATDLRDNSVVAKANLQFVLNAYLKNVGHRYQKPRTTQNPEYPVEVENDFGQLIQEMFDATMAMPENKEWATGGDEDTNKSDTSDQFLSSMYTGSGYPNVNEIAYNVWSSPK